jgi:hypothetical protein
MDELRRLGAAAGDGEVAAHAELLAVLALEDGELDAARVGVGDLAGDVGEVARGDEVGWPIDQVTRPRDAGGDDLAARGALASGDVAEDADPLHGHGLALGLAEEAVVAIGAELEALGDELAEVRRVARGVEGAQVEDELADPGGRTRPHGVKGEGAHGGGPGRGGADAEQEHLLRLARVLAQERELLPRFAAESRRLGRARDGAAETPFEGLRGVVAGERHREQVMARRRHLLRSPFDAEHVGCCPPPPRSPQAARRTAGKRRGLTGVTSGTAKTTPGARLPAKFLTNPAPRPLRCYKDRSPSYN